MDREKTQNVIMKVTGHFGPKTFWHYFGGSKLSRHFGTSADVS